MLRLLVPASVAAASLALAGSASAASLKPGLYYCVGSSSPTPTMYVKVSGTTYWTALQRKGRKLQGDTVKGAFRVSGKTITWKSGTFKRSHYVSTIYPKGYFSLDRKADGVWTGISCYREGR